MAKVIRRSSFILFIATSALFALLFLVNGNESKEIDQNPDLKKLVLSNIENVRPSTINLDDDKDMKVEESQARRLENL